MKRYKNLRKSLTVLLVVSMFSMLFSVTAYADQVTRAVAPTASPEATVAPTATQVPAAPQVDLNGTYHAALGIQTCTQLWISRFAYYSADCNDYYGTDNYAVLNSGAEKTNNFVTYKGTFTDATIQGNGTYTISLTGADFAGETLVSQLHIATDIPVNDTIKFTDIAVKVNNKTIVTCDNGYLETDKQFIVGGMVFLIANHWRPDLVKQLGDKGLSENGNGLEILHGDGNDNIEITFTVSGFAYDKAVEATATPVPTVAATSDSSNTDTAAATEASTDSADGSGNQTLIIIIVAAAIVVVAGVTAVVVSKKKKVK